LVAGGLKFSAISAGYYHTCGVTTGGVYCWGDNTFGEIGDGSTLPDTPTPRAVSNSSTFATIAAGGFHNCALASDGRAYCWGDNTTGELGDPNMSANHVGFPRLVTGGLTFTSIAVGGVGSFGDDYYGYYYGPNAYGHSCGVTTSGVAYCWGSNGAGELGISSFTATGVPTKVSGQH
jgi:alpha-tubulin suppressor-like RCC1 family protein